MKCRPKARTASLARTLLMACLLADASAGSPPAAGELGPKGKMGVESVENKSYERAIQFLEEGLTETPDNPVLYEYLGIAYLSCSSSLDSETCLKKAEQSMDKAIALGGHATFIVDRSLDKAHLVKGTNLLNMKRGLLQVGKGQIEFKPNKDESGTITIPQDDLKSFGMNSYSGKAINMFHLSTKKQGNLDFRTADFSSDEARLLFRLIERNLGVSPKK